jgi:hypothetical protein
MLMMIADVLSGQVTARPPMPRSDFSPPFNTIARKALSDAKHILQDELIGSTEPARIVAVTTALEQCKPYITSWLWHANNFRFIRCVC